MQTKYSKKRQKQIYQFEDEKSKLITNLQNEFLEGILTRLLDSLESTSGLLDNTTKNILSVAGLGNFERDFRANQLNKFLNTLIKRAQKLIKSNAQYFDEIQNLSESRRLAIERKTLASLGVRSNGKIVTGGFLDSSVKITKPIDEVKKLAIRSIKQGLTVKAFRQTVKQFVVKPDKELGILETQLETATGDVFSIIDRDIGNGYRTALGLQYAIYQGGTIKTSRPFCRERNNKVYSVQEIASWAGLDFQGKSTPYNPFTDLGGYNCRHGLDWISNEAALLLRPDLKNQIDA